MSDSILESTKKALGVAPEYDVFDSQIIMLINGVFSTLNDLGVGPEEGFEVGDKAATWDTFLNDDARLNDVKTYVYLSVSMDFDPPQTGHHMAAREKRLEKLEWRINVKRENVEWRDPNDGSVTPIPGDVPIIIDGGRP